MLSAGLRREVEGETKAQKQLKNCTGEGGRGGQIARDPSWGPRRPKISKDGLQKHSKKARRAKPNILENMRFDMVFAGNLERRVSMEAPKRSRNLPRRLQEASKSLSKKGSIPSWHALNLCLARLGRLLGHVELVLACLGPVLGHLGLVWGGVKLHGTLLGIRDCRK